MSAGDSQVPADRDSPPAAESWAHHGLENAADALDNAAGPIAAEPPAGMTGPLGPLWRLIRDQRVAYLMVGATNTALGAVWFVAFQFSARALVGPTRAEHFPWYMVVLLCAHVASVLCAFVLYRRFVFRVRGHVLRDLARFEVVNLVALGINAACLPLLVELVHWPVLASQFAIAGGTTVITFFGHRGYSFRRSDRELTVEPGER